MSLGRFRNYNLLEMDNFRRHGVEDEPELPSWFNPKAWARPSIARLCNTYLEISPSGKGLKAFVTGSWPAK